VTGLSRYECDNDRRRELVRLARDEHGQPLLNGIDYLEVDGPTRLSVYTIHPLDGVLPFAVVDGGVRILGIAVTSVIQVAERRLEVRVDATGDFSTYGLRLVRSAADPGTPTKFDPRLSSVEFSFKVDCPSDFDCRDVRAPSADAAREPDIDYLAKDYASFRRLMLDRLSLLLPGWKERSPADLQVALVELLAYVGDHLSYYQDAVATEAYLGTARKRVSVRRHARLLDYKMHEGCNARAWVVFGVDREITLPKETRILTRSPKGGALVHRDELDVVLSLERPEVFETMHVATLRPAQNRIELYTWSDDACSLAAGATRATVLDVLDEDGGRLLALAPGDVLVLETLDGAIETRHAVRLSSVDPLPAEPPVFDPLTGAPVVEIEWHPEDALPFALRVGGDAGAVARGNAVLAEHGLTMPPIPVAPERRGNHSRAKLGRLPITHRAPYVEGASAAAALDSSVRDAMPVIELVGDGRVWTPRYDLLSSGESDASFVVEMESDRSATLRFGDGVRGLAPSGAVMQARYRVGNGAEGNVGPESLARVVWAAGGIVSVRNPMAATGAIDPESIESVRRLASSAFRRQERAVTAADYGAMAERNPEVQKASGRFRWTGSWNTAFVTVDRKAGLPVDEAFREGLLGSLDSYRMAGHDLEIEGPVLVPVDLALRVCVKPGYFQSRVRAALMKALGSTVVGGQRGFFHPDGFTFGQPLYLSQIYGAAMAVAGVATVDVVRFQRLGRAPNREIEHGVLSTSSLEIVELANDPNFPEKGRLDLSMIGGL
jgi:hypothetical protein